MRLQFHITMALYCTSAHDRCYFSKPHSSVEQTYNLSPLWRHKIYKNRIRILWNQFNSKGALSLTEMRIMYLKNFVTYNIHRIRILWNQFNFIGKPHDSWKIPCSKGALSLAEMRIMYLKNFVTYNIQLYPTCHRVSITSTTVFKNFDNKQRQYAHSLHQWIATSIEQRAFIFPKDTLQSRWLIGSPKGVPF
jgi:hypothetical protein